MRQVNANLKYMAHDGLNTVSYNVSGKEEQPLHTRILVDVKGPRNGEELKGFIAKSIAQMSPLEPKQNKNGSQKNYAATLLLKGLYVLF
jgi:hypothetical protein